MEGDGEGTRHVTVVPGRAEVDRFLGSQHVMRLATASPRVGVPHVVPVWYMYEGGAFYIGTNARTTKARNVRETGRAGFCIDAGVHSPDIFGVAGQGRAELLTGGGVMDTASRILSRYYGGAAAVADSPAAQELLADTDCIILVRPDRMTSWRY